MCYDSTVSWEPAWKSLVQQLVDEGRESVYLERLRRRYDVTLPNRTIEQEILEEMAHALARAEDKVNLALLELELLEERCERDPTPEHVAAFNRKREQALRVRRDLMIHREALRFRRDPRFWELYPVPPARD